MTVLVSCVLVPNLPNLIPLKYEGKCCANVCLSTEDFLSVSSIPAKELAIENHKLPFTRGSFYFSSQVIEIIIHFMNYGRQPALPDPWSSYRETSCWLSLLVRSTKTYVSPHIASLSQHISWGNRDLSGRKRPRQNNT